MQAQMQHPLLQYPQHLLEITMDLLVPRMGYCKVSNVHCNSTKHILQLLFQLLADWPVSCISFHVKLTHIATDN